MITEAQRQRVAQYQVQRERYLRERSHTRGRDATLEHRPILLNHPLYPALLAAPLAGVAALGLFDVLSLVAGSGWWSALALWLTPVAVLEILAVAVPGTVDWWSMPATARSKMIGLWYLIGNVVVTVLFVQSWFLRLGNSGDSVTTSLILSTAGAGAALLTGWLGGEYVDRFQAEFAAEPRPEYRPRLLRVFRFEISPIASEPQQNEHPRARA